MIDFEKNDNELRGACQVIQMHLDVAKEIQHSDYWKLMNEIIRSITPNVKVGVSND